LCVVDRPTVCSTFSDGFLRRRIAELSGDGAYRVTALQVQRDLEEQRPYLPPPPVWRRWDTDDPPFAAEMAGMAAVGAGGYLVFTRMDGLPVAWVLGASLLVVIFTGGRALVWAGMLLCLPFRVVALPARLVRRLVPDRNRVVLTRSAVIARARAVGAEPVDEHGAAPPPTPDPVRFGVLCPDPAVAACLWANDVTDHLGALVVTSSDDLPRGLPVLDLGRATPASLPADLVSTVLRFAATHAGAARTGFLTWPVSG
jgi:hypothetical protein